MRQQDRGWRGCITTRALLPGSASRRHPRVPSYVVRQAYYTWPRSTSRLPCVRRRGPRVCLSIVQKSCNQAILLRNFRHWGIMPIPLSASGHVTCMRIMCSQHAVSPLWMRGASSPLPCNCWGYTATSARRTGRRWGPQVPGGPANTPAQGALQPWQRPSAVRCQSVILYPARQSPRRRH